EVGEERARARLRVAEAVAPRGPLDDARRRRLALARRDGRRQRLRHHGLLCAELSQVDEALARHRGEIARDAAVGADEAARLLLCILQVRGVDERARDLAARQREAALERLAVLAGEEAVLEADGDVVPRQARRDRDRAEEALLVDAVRAERLFPHRNAELILP